MIDWSKMKTPSDFQKEKLDKEIAEDKLKLAQIDLKSIRAIRAILAGVGTAADTTELKALEAEAATVRGKVKK